MFNLLKMFELKYPFTLDECPRKGTEPTRGFFAMYKFHRGLSFGEEAGPLFTSCSQCGYVSPDVELNGLEAVIEGLPSMLHP